MTEPAVYFAERREAVHVLRRGDRTTAEVGRYLGMGRSTHHGGDARYEYDRGVRADAAELSASDREHLAALRGPWPAEVAARDVLSALAADLADRARPMGWSLLTVSLRVYDQRIVAGVPGGLRPDRRRFCTANLEATVAADGRPLRVRRDSAIADPAGLPALAGGLFDRLPGDLAEAAALPERTLPDGVRPVVFDPGACAIVFHELCGHPLEADVVASRQSYLAPLLGKPVAPGWLTVLDDPLSANASFGYRVDDEGVEASPVPLIRDGAVGEIMHSRSTAAVAGTVANGHGRRMSYLYPAIPRQAHTRVLPGPNTSGEVAGAPGEAVRVGRLRVRYVHLTTGEFGLHAPQALLLRDGVPVARLGEVHLFGRGLDALREVEAVAADPAAWIGGGGCGKLNQGPLIVGFEQPAVRIGGLRTVSAGEVAG
ncbi:TldD/PmbA family protein [Actinoplanes siamensis]|uniref:Metalloprotease TldD/E C-terminal domain-containing protein n=1 Tax=Actinoplanes siamensis TaxID=1223317 RepID=A0A919N6N0_9ACTN|nr:TldD/PmbA family protein [Actinoplanes siamensis]GIF05434.1 hypothetical protein Asi03nite_29720 [Actinoplanes siamensis]